MPCLAALAGAPAKISPWGVHTLGGRGRAVGGGRRDWWGLAVTVPAAAVAAPQRRTAMPRPSSKERET